MSDLVGLNAQSPDAFATIAKILSIRGQQAEVQQAQQSARQRAALANFDFNQFAQPDGSYDTNAMLSSPELRAAAGDQILDVIQHAGAANQQNAAAKDTLLKLNGERLGLFQQMIGGLQNDPDVANDNDKGRQKVRDTLARFGEVAGKDALPVVSMYAQQLDGVPKGMLPKAIQVAQMQANGAGQQLQLQNTPNFVNQGNQLTQVSPLVPESSSIPKSLGLHLAPGLILTEDPITHMPMLINQQTQGVRLVGSGQGGPAGGSPTAGPVHVPYPGEQTDIPAFQAEVSRVRSQADQAPLNRNIYQEVLKLADDTNTGQFVTWAQNNPVIGQLFGDNYQTLNKFLEKNALQNMQAMGGTPSDSRLEAAAAANGSGKFNPKALKTVTRFNYATNTALEQYRQGLDQAVGTDNPDYTQLPKFKSAWAKNFDVNAFMLENAVQDGDIETQRQILDGLTTAQKKALRQKMVNLEALAKTGKLP